MQEFFEGDRIRVDIPDETDIDYEQFHGKHGTVTSILSDDTAVVTGEEQDSLLYRIELDSGEMIDLRHHDLRPPLE